MSREKNALSEVFSHMTVWVVALGYFVDIFDLTLFGMVRKASLEDLGVAAVDQLSVGQYLLNSQMFGMLLGGIIFGMLGDKRGRMKTLFASIFCYSIGNLANAFVYDIHSYAVLRFISGLGLAGELGIGVTLISELLSKENRGMGTALVATVGVLGAVFGGIVVEFLPWRYCYVLAGVLGLLLLVARMKVAESPLFQSLGKRSLVSGYQGVSPGSFFSLFTKLTRFKKFALSIGLGIPIWFIAGVLMTFSPELASKLGVIGDVTASRAISISYLGLALGDFLSGYLSQMLRSRKKVIWIFQLVTIFFVGILYLFSEGRSSSFYYVICFFIGIGAGFWALFVVVAAEQFGTNLRATAATSVPNFVRSSVIPMNIFLSFLMQGFSYSLIQASIVLGVFVFGISIFCAIRIQETFGTELDFLE